jgi:hypothetical protein
MHCAPTYNRNFDEIFNGATCKPHSLRQQGNAERAVGADASGACHDKSSERFLAAIKLISARI